VDDNGKLLMREKLLLPRENSARPSGRGKRATKAFLMTSEDQACLDLFLSFIPLGIKFVATMGLLIFFKELVISMLYRPIRKRKL
jgi:hypothetical protein